MNFKTLLTIYFISLSIASNAQNVNKTYAITSNGTSDYFWANIKQIDETTGKSLQDVYQNKKSAFTLSDATKKKSATTQSFKFENNGIASQVTVADEPTLTMVAAAAYDKKHNKLFFTPMRIGELRWLDLNNTTSVSKFYAETSKLLINANLNDEANHITRMDIALDGYGYAITNDANHLIRFSTGAKTEITDLGNLVDAEENKGISIHNKCTSWGGDMIADAFGKLYIISASHQVFKVDIDTKIATYLGSITGLPVNYTTNGAAVNDDGSVLLSSATSFEGFYKLNFKDLVANKIEGSDKSFCASDLANGNLLFQKEADLQNKLGIAILQPLPTTQNSEAKVFPNPITNNVFNVVFDGQKAGKYNVTVTDLSGRVVLTKQINVSIKIQKETIQFKNEIGKGIYLIKATDASNKAIITERIAVQ